MNDEKKWNSGNKVKSAHFKELILPCNYNYSNKDLFLRKTLSENVLIIL